MFRKSWILSPLISVLVIVVFSPGLWGQSRTMNGFEIENPLIPLDEIFHGGPPRDGIPSIDDPKFLRASEQSFLEDEDRVLGVVIDGVAKAYPIRIMDWHEIVNDRFGDKAVVITYCPLCGSGLAFNSRIGNEATEFGVSGLLYKSDVLLYDRKTNSLWSQLGTKAISGPRKGTNLEIIPTANTSWGEWKKTYPTTLVLSTATGHERDYSRSPYLGYKNSPKTYFPVGDTDDRFHPKEFVIGIEINGRSKAYPYSELSKSPGAVVDKFASRKIRVDYNRKSESATITDESGKPMKGVIAFWFAWFAFHPDTEVWTAGD